MVHHVIVATFLLEAVLDVHQVRVGNDLTLGFGHTELDHSLEVWRSLLNILFLYFLVNTLLRSLPAIF